ncbi:SoxZ, partial [Candidatus Endoriftia persephone str. Guaymas]|nr:SoxZ [Candidatus Endoriftia persephone str. Guaymas]
HKGNTVIAALFSGGVSKNPYLSFKFTGGAKGDEIELSWSDNKGGSDSKVAKIK